MLRRFIRPIRVNTRNIHFKHDGNEYPPKMDYINFGLSCYNCILVLSVLWGVESYNEKLKAINRSQCEINELFIQCKKLLLECKRNQ